MQRIKNIHPGSILFEDFLKPLKLSAYRLAKDIGIPQSRISAILKGRRAISADTALRLGKYLGTSAELWMGLQNDYDLEEAQLTSAEMLAAIKPIELIHSAAA